MENRFNTDKMEFCMDDLIRNPLAVDEEAYHQDSMLRECAAVFTTKSANDWMLSAAMLPEPASLWKGMWYQGELACLFADSNVGKSIYAVQIAEEIAKRHRVIYFDCELSELQFYSRFISDTGAVHKFPAGFFRAEFNAENLGDEDVEHSIIRGIEGTIVALDADVIIIDNISFLSGKAEAGDAANKLMMALIELKKRRGVSILVLSHTPKRNLSMPLTQNDMAGSKKLFNFFDSVFAIGMSVQGENVRYVKQLKVRYGKLTYGESNVITAEVAKVNDRVILLQTGTSDEHQHLKRIDRNVEKEALIDMIRPHLEAGKSERQIAEATGLHKSRVHRLIKSMKD